MSIKAINENLTVCGESEYRNQKEVECKLNLTDEEFTSVLSVEASAFLVECSCLAGEIKYSGRTVFNIIYKTDGLITKKEYGVEFEYKFAASGVKVGDKIFAEIAVDGAKANYVNGIATARAIISFKGSLVNSSSSPVLCNLEGAICKTDEKSYVEEIKRVSGSFKLEDEFELSLPIRNVLSHNETAIVTGVQCGIGVIIVDGEVYSNLCLLPLGEEYPFSTRKTVPFRLELDCEGAMPENYAVAFACVKGVTMKAYVDEGKNKSNLQISVDIELCGVLYAERKFGLLLDAYSLDKNIEFTKTEFSAVAKKGVGCTDKNLELEFNYTAEEGEFICIIADRIESVEGKKSESALGVTGTIAITALFNKEGEKRTADFLMPFSFDCLVEEEILFVGANIVSSAVNGNKYSVDIKVAYEVVYSQKFEAICGFSEGDSRKVSDAAISVYVGKEGDSLWDVCKALGVTEEAVLSVNGELAFPLSGEERIIIYREVE